MKTRFILAAMLVFSLAMVSCGNKKTAETSSDAAVQVCDSACTKAAEGCCANDSTCKGSCDGACSGDCSKADCSEKACDRACGK